MHRFEIIRLSDDRDARFPYKVIEGPEIGVVKPDHVGFEILELFREHLAHFRVAKFIGGAIEIERVPELTEKFGKFIAEGKRTITVFIGHGDKPCSPLSRLLCENGLIRPLRHLSDNRNLRTKTSKLADASRTVYLLGPKLRIGKTGHNLEHPFPANIQHIRIL